MIGSVVWLQLFIHVPGAIRTRNLNSRTAAVPRLRPHIQRVYLFNDHISDNSVTRHIYLLTYVLTYSMEQSPS